jgi:signal transduction histidine kinase
LKTPLNAVSGNCHLIRRRFGDALGADGLQLLGKIERSSQHMARLVDDLLMLSRVGAKDLELREIDMSQLARSVMEGLMEQDPGRTVQFEAPAELPVQFDHGLAASLLSNLLGNAWKFTSGRPDARIDISARTLDEATIICIEDNGVGFDSAAAPAVFRPFQRFHSLSQFSGTGVGLVTCQRILRRHGGDIRIASSAGHGTVVELTIPHSQGRR